MKEVNEEVKEVLIQNLKTIMEDEDEEIKEIEINKVNKDELAKRPDWETYFLTLAFVVSQKSFDPSSKCGCIIVSQDGRILSTGYNGPIKDSIDGEIPLTRPEKYCHFIHAEENALLAYSGSYQDIQNATAYVTGRPCHRCLRGLIQQGIRTIIHGSNHTVVVDKADMDAQKIMLEHKSRFVCRGDIKLVDEVRIKKVDSLKIKALLSTTAEYICRKESQKPNYKEV